MLRVAYTRSGLCIVNTHTRHIRTSAAPVSVSLPRACRFSGPRSPRAWYASSTRSFRQQLPPRRHTLLCKQTHAPDMRGMRAKALCTCAGAKGDLCKGQDVSAPNVTGACRVGASCPTTANRAYVPHVFTSSDGALQVEILQNTSAPLSLGFQKHSSLSLGPDWLVASGQEKRGNFIFQPQAPGPRLASWYSKLLLFLFE